MEEEEENLLDTYVTPSKVSVRCCGMCFSVFSAETPPPLSSRVGRGCAGSVFSLALEVVFGGPQLCGSLARQDQKRPPLTPNPKVSDLEPD